MSETNTVIEHHEATVTKTKDVNAVRSGKSEESFYVEIKFQSFLHLKMSYKKCQIQIETFCFAES